MPESTLPQKQETELKDNLKDFKKLVRRAIFLSPSEEVYFNAIPNDKWQQIFEVNFKGNFLYAQRVILNQFKEIEKIDSVAVDKEKNKIANLGKATKFLVDAIHDKTPVLFVTDFDNDGSLAQSIINEYLDADPIAAQNMHVEYAQVVNGNANRGFTVDVIDKILTHKKINPDSKFLVITADNGINSLEEQKKVLAKYPNAKLVVTDHHNPDPEMVVEENDRTVIFNPHYKPTDFYKKFNISGATTVGVLLKNTLKNTRGFEEFEALKPHIDNIDKLSKISNLLDYVETDPADKPEKDYVITRFLKLQPLLNINNSISKIIVGDVSLATIDAIRNKIPKLNVDLIHDEAKNIHIQNHMASILLKIYQKHKQDLFNKVPVTHPLGEDDVNLSIIQELNDTKNYGKAEPINPNFIEQLRPLIFSLSANDSKSPFLDALNEKMIAVFESIKVSEKRMAEELRAGEVITKSRLENSVIAYTDKNILTVFNRKFLNKVYNDENPGFSLTLDNVDKTKVSGSFRSLYNISSILKNKKQLEKELDIKIETPGHERAAGFIIKSNNPEKAPITAETIEHINKFIDASIAKIKEAELASNQQYLLTDLSALHLIDRINTVIRGNVSNFARITPLLKMTPDTVWTDSYTTEQFTMEEIVKNRKYGYVSINTNFHGDTVIVPVELVRKIVKNDYKDFLSLNYMDGGVFMVERVVTEKDAQHVIDIRGQNSKTQEIVKVFEKDFKDKNSIELNRLQIQDNPFFKYHDYGKLNFYLFESMVIGIIDTNKIDSLCIFDVEANGFGNSKLMNFGAMNYSIDKNSGIRLPKEEFFKQLHRTMRGEEFLLTPEEVSQLEVITPQEKEELPLHLKKQLLTNETFTELDKQIYYLHPEMRKENDKKNIFNFAKVKNYIENVDGTVTYNREIKATMLAYLVKDKDFKVPQEMTNLTGITQETLNKYGTETHIVDAQLEEYYKGKNVLFGAHNTPYDSRVLRANCPKFYKILSTSGIYDSALFSRVEHLAYDAIKVAKFKKLPGIDEKEKKVYFYNNEFSDFCLSKFLKNNQNGYFPDRTGQLLLEIENGSYYLVDKVKHEKVKLDITQQELLEKMEIREMPNTAVKYSVEKLSEQWMVHSVLLSDEPFDIQHVYIQNPKYTGLKQHEDALNFFQDNYHFDASAEVNVSNFLSWYSQGFTTLEEVEVLTEFVNEFLSINRNIQQKFSDAWMYKKVLTIKDPTRQEVTNDLVDLVNYQTNIPKDKIRTIFEDSIRFKEKYKIDHILQHEGHVNGPWEGDKKGDVAFEDKLTLSLLAQKMYDSYSHDVKPAIDLFNKYSCQARLIFDRAHHLSEDIANDSYGFRQGILYHRPNVSDLVAKIQYKEEHLTTGKNAEVKVVKFKCQNGILPQDCAVYALPKPNVKITREHIEEDSEKFSFILANAQIRDALGNQSHMPMDDIDQENVRAILEENDNVCLQYKKDLSKRYTYVEYNRQDAQIKKVLDSAIEFLSGGNLVKTRISSCCDIDSNGFTLIKTIVNNYIQNMNSFNPNEPVITESEVMEVNEYFNTLQKGIAAQNLKDYQSPLTKMEQALNNPNQSFANFTVLKEPTFLHNLYIQKQQPLKILLNAHPQLRLLNNFVEKAQKQAQAKLNKKKKAKKVKI